MKVERTIEIAAPPERVWATLMDPRQLGDWVSIHKRLEDAPPGELRKGSKLVPVSTATEDHPLGAVGLTAWGCELSLGAVDFSP